MTGRRPEYGDRPTRPRRVRHGIRLGAGDPPGGPMALRWRHGLEAPASAEILDEGLSYARSGQVAALDVGPGGARGRVQGRAARPYEVRLELSEFARRDWDRVVAAMASEAVYGAKLLAGEMPDGLDDLLEGLGLQLLPPDAVAATCTCGGPPSCKHVLAAALIVARRLDEEPLLVLEMRGMAAPQLLERLRQTRALHTRGVAVAHADPMLPTGLADPPPLEVTDRFWRGDPAGEPDPGPHPYVPHALLRRLGPSPLQGRFPMVGLLASIYDTVSSATLLRRDRAEHIE